MLRCLAAFALLASCEPPAGPSGIGGPAVEVSRSGVVRCADPGARSAAPFRRAEHAGASTSEAWLWGVGMLAGDLDGDGVPEVLSARERGVRLYVQDGAFREWPSPALAAIDRATGGSLADYDGDGDLDVYLTRYGARNVLLRNDGDLELTEVTLRAGVGGASRRSMASTWGDVDRDGDLDLFVGNYGFVDETPSVPIEAFGPAEPSVLYENLGDGTFADRSELLPQRVHDGYTFGAAWVDLDDDGWLDLYVVNDFGRFTPNTALWNQRGLLRAHPHNRSGLDARMTGMGLGIGDLNGDGRPDLLVPQWKRTGLWQSDAALGVWVDWADARGLAPDPERDQDVGWGAELGDIDNDGDLDAVVAYGHLDLSKPGWGNADAQPDAVYVQELDRAGVPVFTDRAAELGLDDRGIGRGFVLADLDGDGWLDVAKRDLSGPDLFALSTCGSEGWLTVELRGPAPNTHAVGARVAVRAGDRRWERTIRAGGTSFASSGPPEAHFGLGALDAVDAVEVRWPDGRVDEVDGVHTRQHIRLTRVD